MRQALVVAIGDEVLSGNTVNGNGAHIAHKLGEIGLKVVEQRVIPDQRSAIKQTLADALKTHDLVIATGGLGPTMDDNTRRSVAELLGCPLRYDEEVARRLAERYGDVDVGIKDQATIPALAKPLHNVVGTAPGLLFEQERSVLILLPGVPVEMRSLLEREVLPYLQKRFPVGQREAVESLHFFQVRELEVDALMRKLAPDYPEVRFGIYPSLGVVHLRLYHPASAAALLPLKQVFQEAFQGRLFTSSDGTLEGAIHEQFVAKQITLATAESCTGGTIASHLTARPGASDYFLGSVVAYSNRVKNRLLGVSEGVLEKHGAVSEETVRAMVLGLLDRVGSDYGIAVSGIAGPTGGAPEKPVGTVWIAVGKRGEEPVTSLLNARGDRAAIITRSLYYALGELLKRVR
ncbi:MAG: CinA family nicotinamide mononucleotide deamidase-related protein [Parachlamydiales bacterium]